ncbi:hypothetical protein MC885_020120 [Smutsia gigantea]|nr:hypothetical protein MC885_020120 [Smutsia gigantea]
MWMLMWVGWGRLEPTSTPFTVTVLWVILPARRRRTQKTLEGPTLAVCRSLALVLPFRPPSDPISASALPAVHWPPVPEDSRQMSSGKGTEDSGEVAPGAPQPTRIDVHFHQESALAKLLLSGCPLLRPPVPSTAFQTRGSSRLLVASWVVQMALGALSGILGGCLYLFYSCSLRESGAALWTGTVAVLAGAVAFIYEKRGGIYWALLRTLLALAAFSTAIAAIIMGSTYFFEYKFLFRDYVCHGSFSSGWPTPPPSTPSPEGRNVRLCLTYLHMLKALFVSLQAMLVGVWILLFLASLVPLGLFCWGRRQHKKVSP